MFLYFKSILVHVGAIGVIGCAIYVLATSYENYPSEIVAYNASTSSVQVVIPVTTAIPESDAGENPAEEIESVIVPEPQLPAAQTAAPLDDEAPQEDNEIRRIQNPYPFPPLSFDVINTEARAALVNIVCSSTMQGVRSITATGIIIDARGIILTNAHVAQFVLLAQSPEGGLTCTIRQGAPARSKWRAEILYIPPVWIKEHAEDIANERSTGTGEHDYALLRITSGVDGAPLPPSFAFLPADTREGIGFLDDPILAASYPAEFLAGNGAGFELYPLSTITKIQELLTFSGGTVDLISIGGTAGAQGGSSGGAIVNAWGHVVGLITTTSEGMTTAERDLRGLTLSYVDRDLLKQTGLSLEAMLSADLAARAADFNANEAPPLIELLLEQITERTN